MTSQEAHDARKRIAQKLANLTQLRHDIDEQIYDLALIEGGIDREMGVIDSKNLLFETGLCMETEGENV